MLRRSLSDSKSRRDEFSSIGGVEHRWLVRCFQDAIGYHAATRKFDLFLADEPAVNDQSQTNEEGNYSSQPNTAKNRCILWRVVSARNNSEHESVKKDHDTQAD